jgi:type I restriction enzyme S subunit
MKSLPLQWINVRLSSIADVAAGIGFPNEYQGHGTGDLPFYKVSDISRAVLSNSGVLAQASNYVTHAVALALKGKPLKAGTTVFAKIGEAVRLNRRAIVSTPCLIDNNVMAVTAKQGISDRYVHHFLRTVDFGEAARSTTVPSLRKGDVEDLNVPLAPVPEQKRIADKLDTVLTRVDAVNTRLARVASLLKRFRQSVLAAATSGRLTEDWRAPSHAPTRSTIALGDLVISIDQGWSPKCEANAAPQEQWAVIKTTAIQALHFYPEENKALPNDLDPRPHLALRDGDVLITRAGPRSRAGITCIVTGDQPRLMLCDKAYRVRVDRSKIHPQMLNLLLNSPEVLNAIDEMKTGISESGVNLTQAKFRELALSVPHKEEQAEIIRRVDTLFAFADRLEARLQTAQTAANRLTPSLLAKAFRGELVPQDPNDEPASELLKRLAGSAPASGAKRGRVTAAKAE